MGLIDIGVSGLRAQQAALSVTGQNITNASTPGYSRQRVDLVTQNAGTEGSRFRGAGARVSGIERLTDEFVVAQVRADDSLRSELSTLSEQISAIDGVILSDGAGLDRAFDQFFAALNDANAAPASLPERQLLLSAAEALVSRFGSVNDQLNAAQGSARARMSSDIATLNEVAASIADLNDRIALLNGQERSGAVNPLLDQRDQLLRQVAQTVGMRAVAQTDGAVNVFIGKGQPLVLGNRASSLSLGANSEVLLSTGGEQALEVTNAIAGGSLGASLQFSSGLLTETQQRLGQLAQSFAFEFNAVHREGLSLEGEVGRPFFADLNDPVSAGNRVTREDRLPSDSGSLRVAVLDPTVVPLSDYRLEFSELGDGSYTIRRLNDGQLVANGAFQGFEQTLSFDGIEVTLQDGSFGAGQRYRLSPLTQGATDLVPLVQTANEIALGAPAIASSAISNSGTGVLEVAGVTDIGNPRFDGDPLAAEGLRPPLLVRFTAPDRFDLLDNSDPTAPVQLDPPVRSQRYSPGGDGSLRLGTPGSTRLYSAGPEAGEPQTVVSVTDPSVAIGNGYSAQTLEVNGPSGVEVMVLAEAQSAVGSAAALDRLQGVQATAYTDAVLSELTIGLNAQGPELRIGALVYEDVRDLNDLAVRINNDADATAAGVIAQLEGDRLRVTQVAGEDLELRLKGPLGTSVSVAAVDGDLQTLRGGGDGTPAILAGSADLRGGVDFSAGGPFTMTVTVGGESAQVQLAGVFNSADQIAFQIQSQIDTALGAGRVEVAIDSNGALRLSTGATGSDARLLVSPAAPLTSGLGLPASSASGQDRFEATAVGGQIAVLLDEGYSLEAQGGGLFAGAGAVFDGDLGPSLNLKGRPDAGDQFEVSFTAEGVLDNRNGLALAALQDRAFVGDPAVTVTQAFAGIVESVGATAGQTAVDLEAAEALLEQSEARLAAVSGVNLDEEAANLIRFEQGYNAAAQVISVARDLFNTLFSVVS